MDTKKAASRLGYSLAHTWLRIIELTQHEGIMDSPRLPDRRRSTTYTWAVSFLILMCLVGSCLLTIMSPVAMAADDYEWTLMELEVPEGKDVGTISCIWGSSSSDVWALSPWGWAFHYDGSTWVTNPGDTGPSTGGSPGTLKDVHGTSESSVFAVGGKYDGTLSHYDGSKWDLVCLEHNSSYLRAVWSCSEHDVFAVGGSVGNLIIHYDGDECSDMYTPIDLDGNLNDIWASSADDVFVVGDDGVVLRYDGSNWATMDSDTSENLYAIWGASAANVFAAGDSGTIVHYDGSTWGEVDSVTSARLQGICGCSSQDVFAVGESGTILHYNGTEWSPIAFDTELGSPDFSCVWASSSSDIFVTSGSNVYHYGPSAASDDDGGLAVWIIVVIVVAAVVVLGIAGYLLLRRRGNSGARQA